MLLPLIVLTVPYYITPYLRLFSRLFIIIRGCRGLIAIKFQYVNTVIQRFLCTTGVVETSLKTFAFQFCELKKPAGEKREVLFG